MTATGKRNDLRTVDWAWIAGSRVPEHRRSFFGTSVHPVFFLITVALVVGLGPRVAWLATHKRHNLIPT